jgi:AcrR family transcriptional regulator
MGRPARFDEDQLLDAARALLLESGSSGFSVAAVAESIGAPSGSVYHRFASRDVLVASLWLRAVERFQAGLFDALDAADPLMGARRAAQYVVSWCRQDFDDARLLLLYRSKDLLREGWPDEVRARNAAQLRRVERAMAGLYQRVGARDRSQRRRVRFAVMDIPYGAVRGPLAAGKRPDRMLEMLVDEAAAAVLAGLHDEGEKHDDKRHAQLA